MSNGDAEFRREVVRTLDGAASVELPAMKGSRFLADLAAATSGDAAAAFITSVREREPSASHHCWAWRLQDGRERANDDGEPRDTGGTPILRHLAGADLTDVVCVVTRYFGGTKLGRGGLIRAYGGAAAAAIGAATIIERPVLATLTLRFPYDLAGVVRSVMTAFDARKAGASYGADTTLEVTLVAGRAAAFTAAIREATAGRVSPRP